MIRSEVTEIMKREGMAVPGDKCVYIPRSDGQEYIATVTAFTLRILSDTYYVKYTVTWYENGHIKSENVSPKAKRLKLFSSTFDMNKYLGNSDHE
jgi:hypothetical protein